MLNIKNIDMTGADIEEEIPADVDAFTIQAIGGNATIKLPGNENVWTLIENRAENFPSKVLAAAKSKLIFNGDSGTVIEIWYEKGGMKSMFGV